MPKNGKMGRNPLDRLQDVLDEPLKPASFSILNGPSTSRSTTRSSSLLASIEKVKEMQIQVDWPELYRSTLGQPVKKLLRILSNN